MQAAASSGSLSDGDVRLTGECAKTGKCSLGDFTPEERRAINAKIKELSTDLMAKPHGSAKNAAVALHNSELHAYAQELGLEFFAVINADGTIVTTGTGFSHRSVGVMARSGQSQWHNHPTGAATHTHDMLVLGDHKVSWNFTSGDHLYGADVQAFGFNSKTWDGRAGYKEYVYKNGSWR